MKHSSLTIHLTPSTFRYPPSLHAEWTIKAAEHGKHVLCEKPLAANTDEAITMADACRQNGVQLMDGVMWVHHERTAAMKQKLMDDTLGRLRRVTAAFTFNWDTIPVGNIRAMKEFAGGSLGDLAVLLYSSDSLGI